MTRSEILLNSLCPNEREQFDIWFAELNTLLTVNGEVIQWFDYFVEGCSPKETIASYTVSTDY